MKRLFFILSALLLCLSSRAQIDSTLQITLRDKLDEYAKAICTESIETQCNETDFLISSCSDSLIRQFTAIHLLEHYTDSKIMVASNIMVHIYDRWFANGEVKFTDEFQDMSTKMIVELARQNLIGCKAPELSLRDTLNNEVQFNPGGKLSLVIFYSDECSRCRLEVPALCSMLDRKNCPVNLFAIYTKDDPEAWKRFRKEKFVIHSGQVQLAHLWDPEDISEFSLKYGVIQTPKIFLTDEKGIIIGRELDYRAAEDIITLCTRGNELDYGTDGSMQLFEQIFADEADMNGMVDYLASSCYKKGGERMFRQMMGDLLYWLSSKHKGKYVKTADYLIDNYIFSENHSRVWANPDDSLKIVGLADMLKDQFSKAAVGSKPAPIKLKGTYLDGQKSKTKVFRLDKLPKKHTYVIFHTETCNDCKNEIKAAKELLSFDKDLRVLTVSIPEAEKNLSEDEFSSLLDAFDLSSLPYVIELGDDGLITDRYISLVTQKK